MAVCDGETALEDNSRSFYNDVQAQQQTRECCYYLFDMELNSGNQKPLWSLSDPEILPSQEVFLCWI